MMIVTLTRMEALTPTKDGCKIVLDFDYALRPGGRVRYCLDPDEMRYPHRVEVTYEVALNDARHLPPVRLD